MRIAYLAAGAGGMYCGSCLRDNRLAAALKRQGRDVVLLPLYTPLRTDETDVSERRVLFGGINVYLQQRSALFRRMPRVVGRMLSARWLLRLAGRMGGSTNPKDLGPMTVSVLQGPSGEQRKELATLIEALRRLAPTVVHLPNLLFLGAAAPLREALGGRIVVNLAGEDIFLDALPEPYQSQAAALIRESAAHVDAFVAPSKYYASYAVSRFGLDPARVHYVPLGIDVDGIAGPGAAPKEPFTIGYLARICPEKGLHVLCEAFVRMRRAGRRCRLRAAGYLGGGDRVYFREVLALLKREGLLADFEYVGEVTRAEKLAFLSGLHVMSVPSVYQESKGLYVLEALACGVPVVQPEHGSFPELIEATGGGLLFEPGRPDELADALGRLMDDADLRVRLGAAGREAVFAGFTEDVMADSTWALYERCAAGGDAASAVHSDHHASR